MTCSSAACSVHVDFNDTNFQCESGLCPKDYQCVASICVANAAGAPDAGEGPNASETPDPNDPSQQNDPASPPANQGFRSRISIDYTEQENLTGFPLLVSFDSQLVDPANAGANGESLRFYDRNGTLLPHEIDSWQPQGTSRVWVKTNLSNGQNDDIYLYWGQPQAGSAAPTTDTWNAQYIAVWHLDEDPAAGTAGAILDSSVNAHHGTAAATMNAQSLREGPLGTGLYFDAIDDTVTIPDSAQFELSPYSYSFWIRGDEAPHNRSIGQPIFNADDQFNFSWNHTINRFRQASAHRNTTEFVPAPIAGTLLGQTWYFVAVTYDGTTMRIYLNGALSGVATTTPPVPRVGDFNLGNDPAIFGFAGSMDEVRIFSGPLSPSWIAASYRSATAADFASLGPKETL